jgi:hypothetical protein
MGLWIRRPLLLLSVITLAGCNPPAPITKDADAGKPAAQSTLLQSQTEALDKAKQVEQILQNAASAQQATINSQTQ